MLHLWIKLKKIPIWHVENMKWMWSYKIHVTSAWAWHHFLDRSWHHILRGPFHTYFHGCIQHHLWPYSGRENMLTPTKAPFLIAFHIWVSKWFFFHVCCFYFLIKYSIYSTVHYQQWHKSHLNSLSYTLSAHKIYNHGSALANKNFNHCVEWIIVI